MLADNEDEYYTDPYTIITKNIRGSALGVIDLEVEEKKAAGNLLIIRSDTEKLMRV